MPALDGPHRRLVKQDMARTVFHSKGFHSTFSVHQNTQDDGPLLSHLSRFRRVEWRSIVAIARIAPSRTAAATSPPSGARDGYTDTTLRRARARNAASS